MNRSRRDYLVKALGDVGKGILIGAVLAAGTGKLPLGFTLIAACSGLLFLLLGYLFAGGLDD